MLSCFKTNDIRGRIGEELNEDIFYRIGRAYAQYFNARRVVVGGDVRSTSEQFKRALANGLMDGGADVLDLGITGTEEIYFAAFHLDVDGGLEVTASHNPIDYNGIKLVARGARPVASVPELKEIQSIASSGKFVEPLKKGGLEKQSVLEEYVNHLLTYIDLSAITPKRLVVNSGNGAAAHVIDAIEERFVKLQVPIEFVKVHHKPDGSFPNGIPNPLLPENRVATSRMVLECGADMGVAWDGDFDRCFLFDERGRFIEGYYIVGLLAEAFLMRHPGEKIVHDPRLVWNTREIVRRAGGIPVQSKTGHAFIKERMRAENAIYGGEMSAHHYFRDFAYCDSGMIPWLLVVELLSCSGKTMAEMVGERVASYPCSGEINFRVKNVSHAIECVTEHFRPRHPQEDCCDGISLEFKEWRFNLRGSNTEPLLRLNVETRGDTKLLAACTAEIIEVIERGHLV